MNLIAHDYADGPNPMKVTAYDPATQVIRVTESSVFPRADGKRSTQARELILDRTKIDSYDKGVNNGSNRTQLIENSMSNPFCAFKPGVKAATSFVTRLDNTGLPKLGSGDASMVIQWKSIRKSGGGSDPYLLIGEQAGGFILIYNSVQYWKSVGQASKGVKKQWQVPLSGTPRQIKLRLEATFASDSSGGFTLLGDLGSGSKTLVPFQKLPTISPGSPGSTVSWGPYQEQWLPSVRRRYWDVEVFE